MSKKPYKILAINPGSRYIGTAVFNGPKLLNWRVKVIKDRQPKEKWEKIRMLADNLIELYQPDAPMLTVKEAMDRAQMLQRKHRLSFDMIAVAKRLRPNIHPDSHTKVLTDDRAPVNWLRTQEKRQSP